MAKIEHIEHIKISELKAYENNAKKHPEKQLKLLEKSINEFGFVSPVLIDEDNNIIAGHGRTEAAKRLGIDKVPCVRVEGLTEEQRKAYIIADNKLNELGSWDKSLVASEISLLSTLNFNVDITGFNIDSLPDLNLSLPHAVGEERMRTVKAYNMDMIEDVHINDDYWQIPLIKNDGYVPEKLIGFNYAKTSKTKAAGIHFFIDDYQFERIWANPEKYVDTLKQYECVISPEFSLYWDMPLPMKLWNTYRNRFIGAYLQQHGIKVIPSICWADENTFDFCFLGVEQKGIVAVETYGTKVKKELKDRWNAGMRELIKRIDPDTILIYGSKDIDFDFQGRKVIYFENQVLKNWGK